MGAYETGKTTDAKLGEIAEQIERLETRMDQLESVVDCLLPSLATVLLPEPPSDALEPKLEECGTIVGKRLQQFVARVGIVVDIVERLDRRIAL